LILSKQKYKECVELYKKRWNDKEFLKGLDANVDHGELKDKADKLADARYSIASQGALAFGTTKIYPLLRDCVKTKNSKPFILLRLRSLKSEEKGDEMQRARSMTLNGYVDTMMEVVEEILNA